MIEKLSKTFGVADFLNNFTKMITNAANAPTVKRTRRRKAKQKKHKNRAVRKNKSAAAAAKNICENKSRAQTKKRPKKKTKAVAKKSLNGQAEKKLLLSSFCHKKAAKNDKTVVKTTQNKQ